jgi:hypothetical protein
MLNQTIFIKYLDLSKIKKIDLEKRVGNEFQPFFLYNNFKVPSFMKNSFFDDFISESTPGKYLDLLVENKF